MQQPVSQDRSPLEAGRNCWRIRRAAYAGVLVDAAAYFRAVRRAILGARSVVYIAGWDLHSATALVRGGDAEDTHADARTLREVLLRAVEINPDLRVYVLLWDWGVLYAGERELLPRINLDWRLPEAVRLELDGAVPIGASQHQKLAVVDDEVAFCGGIDLTVRRWDRCAHDPLDPARIDHEGEPFEPYHDIQMAVAGGSAAAALGDELRRRWRAATGESLEPPVPPRAVYSAAPALPEAGVVFSNVQVAIARTVPDPDPEAAVREVRDSVVDIIASARDYIYIENQFVSADAVSRALAERVAAAPQLEVLIVTPRTHDGWLESRSMGAGRDRFMQHLADAGVLERVHFVYPVVGEGEPRQEVFVHSKLMVIDGRLLRVGSANLNNRSMGYDSECDLILLADSEQERKGVSAVLHDLLAEHLGSERARVADAVAAHGLLGAVRELNGRSANRGFEWIERTPGELSLSEDLFVSLADPERPVALSDFLSMVNGDQAEPRPARGSAVPLLAVLVVLGVLALVWRTTPIADLAERETLTALLDAARNSPWTPGLVIGIYVLGGIVMLPVTALILATGLAFDALTAFVYALAGVLLSAAGTYAAGRYFGSAYLEQVAGGRVRPIADAVRRRGLFAMATLRLIPVAPFTVVNVVAGAARISLRDYLAGTVLGMTPGIAVITAFGDRVGQLITELSWSHAAQVAALALVWVALVIGARRVLRTDDERDPA